MALLPVVANDTGFSIAHYLNRYDGIKDEKEVIKKELKLIAKENPAVAEFIKLWSLKEKKNLIHTGLCGILVYRLLRSQAESDQMEGLKLGD